jgi:DNA-binding XRE family transcriptional regulator
MHTFPVFVWLVFLEGKVDQRSSASMTHRATQNHIRRHRKRTGLSQREISLLLGYKNQWQISRQERSDAIPPLVAALAYQVIFQVPVSVIFAPMHSTVLQTIERNLADLEHTLTERSSGRLPRTTEHKLKWLRERRK